ncbi:DUF262 domain-containing protein [Spirosoma montaniterrae]|uniref:GmrSD restriction endonucleases N-terminal domain-containing protein n=1 Tax=Spirosoma montaniterrae TaxID=1178516 RepID=A0A1P9WSF2_9BACT|nr:DUF262 domain-containing protein [Spirosoma montaniterrae]AQG78316.1 hypothetical protein AWR27_02560 [Spirosoma montaniterrae]
MTNELIEADVPDIEPTDESGVESDIKEPFDPKDINITVEPKTMDNLVQRLNHNEIDLDPDFQRKGNLWAPDVQSRLIESLMLRFPLPAFYFDAESEDNWLVVDGLQRLWTLKNFVVDKTDKRLRLRGLEILKDYEGKTFDELPRPMQRRIMETQVTAYIIKPGTPRPVKYNVFRRINTGGLMLNPMEIRHALNQGPAAKFLKEITESDVFNQYIPLSDRRMADRELALRYVAFRLTPYRQYTKPLTGFLDTAMEKLSRTNAVERTELKAGLFRAFTITEAWFGREQFSRSYGIGGKKLLNGALFEVWTSQVASLNYTSIERINEHLSDFQEDYKRLLTSDDFIFAITRATTDNRSVTTRFEAIEKLIARYSA